MGKGNLKGQALEERILAYLFDKTLPEKLQKQELIQPKLSYRREHKVEDVKLPKWDTIYQSVSSSYLHCSLI